MIFDVFGPFTVKTEPSGRIEWKIETKATFWKNVEKQVPGLGFACGCYVFAIRSGGGTIPWYVGKSESRCFRDEVFTPHKLDHYNGALHDYERGTAVIFFLARLTPKGWFSKPSSNRAVEFLETTLIGMALGKNREIRNVKDTTLLRNLTVKGFINSGNGHPSKSASALKRSLSKK